MGVVYLVRHGQASFGTDDYDRLSELGAEQARITGDHLGALRVRPTSIIHGAMLRQRQTAGGIIAGLEATAGSRPVSTVGATTGAADAIGATGATGTDGATGARSASGSDHDSVPDPIVDDGWNEFNAWELTDALPDPDPRAKKDSRVFQGELERGCARWASGEHDADYTETFREFTDRVDRALDTAVAALGSGESAIVVSSSGAIAWTAARLLGAGFDQWLAFNRVTINTGITKIISGRTGTSLISFNEHGHQSAEMTTYR